MSKKEQVVEVPPIIPQKVTVTIVGDSDLVLNKMNNATARLLIDQRKDKAKDTRKVNEWEEIVTSIHWLDGDPDIDPDDYSEETLKDKLEHDKPCITAFGMNKQLNKAVVRNKIETYSTGFDANVNVLGFRCGLIPVNFSQYFLDERLMSPKKGSPVLARLNHFSGWSADVPVSFMDNVYSLNTIISIFNLTGFGLGIGSGTSSGYGRFHVEAIK